MLFLLAKFYNKSDNTLTLPLETFNQVKNSGMLERYDLPTDPNNYKEGVIIPFNEIKVYVKE